MSLKPRPVAFLAPPLAIQWDRCIPTNVPPASGGKVTDLVLETEGEDPTTPGVVKKRFTLMKRYFPHPEYIYFS